MTKLFRSAVAAAQANQTIELVSSAASLDVDWELAFARPTGHSAYHYWKALGHGGNMPKRTDLRPAQMRRFLSHVNLVDVSRDTASASFAYQVRLQGLHGQGVFGEMARRPLAECLAPLTESRLTYSLGLVANAGRAVRISARVTAGGRSWLQSESLMAPLCNARDEVDGIFWVFDSWREV